MENIEKNEPKKTPEEIAIEEAEIFIKIKIQECNTMGNNDYEIPTLMRLIEQVKSGEISPEEAKRTAQQIYDSKQRD